MGRFGFFISTVEAECLALVGETGAMSRFRQYAAK
jgi:hypothetical protein